MRKTLLGAALAAVILAGGCSEDELEPATPSSSEQPSPDADSSPTDGGSDAEGPLPAPAPTVAGGALPRAFLGTFQERPEEYFHTFYELGDQFCVDNVGTDQNCYAVRGDRDLSAEPIELGVATVEGDLLTRVPTRDPSGSCLGATNQAQWSKAPGGLRLTPTTDCHGLRPSRLTQIS